MKGCKVKLLSVSLYCVSLLSLFSMYEANDVECGSKILTRPLVIAGPEARTNRGEWPFAAALYLANEFSYLCGGTIISNKHVLTAAHCIQAKYSSKRLLPNELLVRIGAYNLTIVSEAGAVQRNVSEIYVHPNWEVYENEYDADMGILVLSDNITFTNYIQPICLPSDDDLIDENGYIVGWGLTEKQAYEEIPRQAVVRVFNDTYCYRRDYLIVPFSSSRTFCGGDGTGVPNFGDSGGGLFILSGKVWVQVGIISAIRTNSTGHVTTNSLTVYTNVKFLKNWIIDTVTQTGSAVGEVRTTVVKIGLHCVYMYTSYNETYDTCACLINDLNIHDENVEVIKFTGSRINGCSKRNVELIVFHNGTMIYFPGGIGKIFKNLIKVEINSRLKTKYIRRSKLRSVENLVHFWADSNDIETIEEDSLWDLVNLEEFLLKENKLKEIKEKTFERNVKLKEVYLHSNKLQFIPANLFQKNLLLEKISFHFNLLQTIDETTFFHNPNLRAVYLDSNQIEFLPKMLFRNNLFLEIVELSDNSLKTIDEDIFNNKTHLREVYLNYNQLEFLPRNLFKNNLLLEIVSFESNRLNTILIDFNAFKNVIKIDFADNFCINVCFVTAENAELYPQRYRNKVSSVSQIQRVIDADCGSK